MISNKLIASKDMHQNVSSNDNISSTHNNISGKDYCYGSLCVKENVSSVHNNSKSLLLAQLANLYDEDKENQLHLVNNNLNVTHKLLRPMLPLSLSAEFPVQQSSCKPNKMASLHIPATTYDDLGENLETFTIYDTRYHIEVVDLDILLKETSSSSFANSDSFAENETTQTHSATVTTSSNLGSSTNSGSQIDQIMKILVIGNPKCGKSSIIKRYVNHLFSDQYNTTIGADYQRKDLRVQVKASSQVTATHAEASAAREKELSVVITKNVRRVKIYQKSFHTLFYRRFSLIVGLPC